jgi:quercetin 2,3-dioxygenase
MTFRSVRNLYPAVREDIADLTTYRALPTAHVEMIDPFLFLNHHGPQLYRPQNRGLPFGPHPHRGFETVTFILEGDIEHRDSGGHRSVINAGGMQWMTAGRGLIHSEESSDAFKQQGGPLEILQLWVNLPARLKMTQPRYIGLQHDEIPMLATEDGLGQVQLIAGSWQSKQGAVKPLTDITVMTVSLQNSGTLDYEVPAGHSIFFYVVRGTVEVNGQTVEHRHLVDFGMEGESISLHALQDAVVLFCHASPYNEPVVSHGPFVMNTREEIHQAIVDYQNGLFN